MSGSDDMRQRLERLKHLRKLGLRRGASGVAAAQSKRRPERGPDRQSVPDALPPQSGDAGSAHMPGWAAVQLPGELADTPFGPAWVRTERYPLKDHPELAEWLCVVPAAAVALDRNESLWRIAPSSAAFIDTETTGLSLGAGTYTFLIGLGTYELPIGSWCGEEAGGPPGDFVVRQYFMRNPAEERAQLHLVEQALAGCTGIVSFNGRGFDMPLINNRFILAEMLPPLAGAPHLDLLPPARRLWRARWGSCSLGSLERNVLELVRTAEDVPGYLIPDIYRNYYQTGLVSDMLVRVFYHNLQDIVSMPLLAARMARRFQRDVDELLLDELHPLECLSLGRCYDALAWTEASIEAYRAALAGALTPSERAQALCELGFLYKRLQRRDQAVALWEEWIGSLPGEDLTPYIELAKHHEWCTRDLAAARGWAAWALRIVENANPGDHHDVSLADLQHRLIRLESKLAGIPVKASVSEDD